MFSEFEISLTLPFCRQDGKFLWIFISSWMQELRLVVICMIPLKTTNHPARTYTSQQRDPSAKLSLLSEADELSYVLFNSSQALPRKNASLNLCIISLHTQIYLLCYQRPVSVSHCLSTLFLKRQLLKFSPHKPSEIFVF